MPAHDKHTQNQHRVTPASALWNQRLILAKLKDEIRGLHEAVGDQVSMELTQWSGLLAFALEYKPDLIVELGRAHGNSTCVFTQAANLLGDCRVVSVCRSELWEVKTLPAVTEIVPPDWFEPLTVVYADILRADYKKLIGDSRSVLLFWDAHGFDVGECVLGGILPLLEGRQHVVIVHDVSDARYGEPEQFSYKEDGLWRGNDWKGRRIFLGTVDTNVEQVISIVDFTTRNGLTLHSADYDLHNEFGGDSGKLAELVELLGEPFFDTELRAHWGYFSLNEGDGPFHFPKFRVPEALSIMASSAAASLWNQRYAISTLKDRLLALFDVVDSEHELPLYQGVQFVSFIMEYKPDLIIELGRSHGRAACFLTEAANQLVDCTVASVGPCDAWEEKVRPALSEVVPPEWLYRLTTINEEIPRVDFEQVIGDRQKVLLFWNTPGYDVAECVLGRIMPILQDREHVVIVRNMSDTRNLSWQETSYSGKGIWRSTGPEDRYVYLGAVQSRPDLAVSILEFITRNKLTLNSADYDLYMQIGIDPKKIAELENTLGAPCFDKSLQAHWVWFSLNERNGPYHFPRFRLSEQQASQSVGSKSPSGAVGVANGRLNWLEELQDARRMNPVESELEEQHLKERVALTEMRRELEECRRWNAELHRAKTWLEEQWKAWQATAHRMNQFWVESQEYIEEIEDAKSWLKEQSRNWQMEAKNAKRKCHELNQKLNDMHLRVIDLEKHGGRKV